MVKGPLPPSLPADAELAGGGNPAVGCTLTGTPDDLKVFYTWNYRTPSKGLQPERFTFMAGVAGIHDKTMTQVAELPAELGGPPSNIIATDGGPVFDYCCRGKNELSTAAIDPNTLSVKWTDNRGIATYDRSTVAFYDVWENRLTIRDVASGSDSIVENVDPAGPSPQNYELTSGYVLEQTGDSDNVGYYSTLAHQFYPDILVDDRVTTDPEISGGKLLLKGVDQLKLVDIGTGAVVFELSAQELKAVDTYMFANSGDYLYIANSSDSPVIDIRTHQQVSSGWKVRPLDTIGKSWVLVDHRPTTVSDCYEGLGVFSCGGSMSDPKQIVLEHFENGVYPGPWF
jgi:hypothetical protein